jgi:hypothetical protein
LRHHLLETCSLLFRKVELHVARHFLELVE